MDKILGVGQSRAILIKGCDVQIREIEWVWEDWLPTGKLTILAGAGGSGKTSLVLSLAATISSGGSFPDGSLTSRRGNVIIWSSEDEPEDVLVPRLIAMGADLNRIYFISGKQDGYERKPFNLSSDMKILSDTVSKIVEGVSLLVIDPIVGAIEKDINKANDVRNGLQPLLEFAHKNTCAIIGISHLGKGTQGKDATERILGSQAFSALARMVWIAIRNRETGEGFLIRSKSNISSTDGGIKFEIELDELENGIKVSKIIWRDMIHGEANEVLYQVENFKRDQKNSGVVLEDVKNFLRNLLHDGPMLAVKVQELAELEGFSRITIFRASKELQIRKYKQDMKGGWIWNME